MQFWHDQTGENDTIHYIPGSHRWHRVKDGKAVPFPITDIDFKNMDSVKDILTEEVLNYFAEGTRSNTNEALLQGIPIIPCGQVLESRFFPKVFYPKWM